MSSFIETSQSIMSDSEKLEKLDKDVTVLTYRVATLENHLLVTAQKLDSLPEKLAKVVDDKLVTHQTLCQAIRGNDEEKDDKKDSKKEPSVNSGFAEKIIYTLIGLIAALAGVKLLP